MRLYSCIRCCTPVWISYLVSNTESLAEVQQHVCLPQPKATALFMTPRVVRNCIIRDHVSAFLQRQDKVRIRHHYRLDVNPWHKPPCILDCSLESIHRQNAWILLHNIAQLFFHATRRWKITSDMAHRIS